MSIIKGILYIEGSRITLELKKGWGWTGNEKGEYTDNGEYYCWNVSYTPGMYPKNPVSFGYVSNGSIAKELDFKDFICHYNRYIGKHSRVIKEYKLEFNLYGVEKGE